jgi:hypothetical protein
MIGHSKKKQGCCKCLKSIDQTGVPVTLNWQGKNTHETRMGGLVSILGLLLVVSFILGSIIAYSTFSQISQQTLISYVDFAKNVNCSASDNEC